MAEKGIQAKHDGQCQYQHNNERCPLPGNSSNAMGRGGMFLCLHHARPGNMKHDFAQDEHFRMFADRKCVEEYVALHYGSELLCQWQQHIADNPDWRRGQAETKSDYAARMRELHRKGGLTAAVKRMAI